MMKFLSLFGIGDWEVRFWSDTHARRFEKTKQSKLTINRNKRWKGEKNYDFLLGIKDYLRELTIVDFSEKIDIKVLEFLFLEKLTLEVGIKCQWPKNLPYTLR